ncbi:CBS domain-containing protein [Oceanobacillus timonensis]|uniref:CBS domain-containing protein n=1 Tax=Oceanobacillus timonensis TaxID=1926285 RepID=UPI0009BA217E|nr:CBS domain-containing protein [Oceanobacillus timonensis]
MGIPVVTFLFFILASLMYYAVKETRLSQSDREEVRFHSRFLSFILLFIGLFSSAWLTVTVTAPLGRNFSDAVFSFSHTMHTFIPVFISSFFLFGIWISAGYLLPKWLAKKYPHFIMKRFPRLFPDSFSKTNINERQPSDEQQESQNIIEFSGNDVGEIATHRTDLTVLQIDATLEEVFSVIQKTDFTRIPVYEEDIDQIAGILHVKDFFHHLKSNTSPAFFSLHHLIRPAAYVRMNQEMDAVFKDMREKDYSIAIVLDEFGGTQGLITLEDIIRDITKDLLGDHHPITMETKDIFPLSGNRYLVNGATDLFILEGSLGVTFPIDTPHQTLRHFLTELIDWQSANQKNTVYYKHLKFTVHSVKDNQIESVIITVLDQDIMHHQFIG